MSDTVTLSAGSADGAVIATDHITDRHYQIVKLTLGALNSATLLSGGSGTTDAGTVRVTLATDVALPAGTNAIGKLAANSGVDIGDVDVTSAIITGGATAHDAAGAAINPLPTGGYASAAAPTDVSADTDIVRAWHLRNGAAATVITAAGALIGGDATNGLDVDVTRVGGTVAVTQSGTWDEVGINDSGNSITVDWAGTAPPIGAGVEATALRVTLATDSTGVVSIDDNGASLTVDGTVAVSSLPASTNTLEVVGDVAQDAAVGGNPILIGGRASAAAPTDMSADGDSVYLWTTLKGALNVADGGGTISIDDGAGNISIDDGGNSITVDNGGTFAVQVDGAALTALQTIDNIVLVEDAASAGGESGVMALAVRKDTGGTLASADGDFTPFQVDASGALRVTGGGGGTEYTEDAAASADPVGTALILVRKDTPAALTSADGDNVAMRGTDYGAAYVTLLDTGGSPVSVGGGTQYTEDAAAAANPIGNAINLIRDDSLARTVTADGDNVALGGSAAGAAYVEIVGGTTKLGSATDGLLVNLGANNDVTVTGTVTANLAAGTNTNEVVGDAAHDAAAAGNPLLMGAYASAAVPTDVSADADVTRLWALRSGALATQPTYGGVLAVAGNGASGTGVQRVTLANDSTGVIATVSALGTGTTGPQKAEDVAHNTGDMGVYALAVRDDSLAAHSGTDGDYESLHTNADGALWTTLAPSATGGLTTAMFSGSDGSSILVATAQVVKASAGVLYGYYAYNPEAAVTFVHFYNTAAASVTVGTTNPLFTIQIPAASAANLAIPQGVTFSNAGWSVAATTTAGGNTAPATGVSLTVWYK